MTDLQELVALIATVDNDGGIALTAYADGEWRLRIITGYTLPLGARTVSANSKQAAIAHATQVINNLKRSIEQDGTQ